MESGTVLRRSRPVLTFAPGIEPAGWRPPATSSRAEAAPDAPGLPVVPLGARRSSSPDVAEIVGPVVRAAGTSSSRTLLKVLAIIVALAALGIFAGLNMRWLTENVNVPGIASQVARHASGATASERLQARGMLAPRKEAAPAR